MKYSKAVHVTKHKIREDQNFVYRLDAKHNRDMRYAKANNNFACQFDSRVEHQVCTCKRPQKLRYPNGRRSLKCVYHTSRSYTDIGVGSVKALQKKRVRKVYLPETNDRGCGSSDLSSVIFRKNRPQMGSYYDYKRTSSKCVGGLIEYKVGCVISEKLSPIIDRRSNTTNTCNVTDVRHIEIGSNTTDDNSLVTTATQFENIFLKSDGASIKTIEDNCIKITNYREIEIKKTVLEVSVPPEALKLKSSNDKKIKATEKKDHAISSDSLVQHVHNLEGSSNEKQSKTSADPMENKLEREYRRMFSKNKESFQSYQSRTSVDNKPLPEMKSGSIVRRRFEALRRGITKKDEKKYVTPSSQDSLQSHKDESVTSDPPSLESRSFTDAKKFSPVQSKEQDPVLTPSEPNPSSMQQDSSHETPGVKGMFKTWGKKFDFEEETTNTKPSPSRTNKLQGGIDIKSKPHKDRKSDGDKKNKKKFFFFKKKPKEKPVLGNQEPVEKDVYKASSITTGRCELRDGLTLRIGQSNQKKKPVMTTSTDSSRDEDIKRKTWLQKFLSDGIESKRSVNVRWNNNLYAASSSTVFELMDTIYKNTGLVLRSRSDVTTEASCFLNYPKPKVNFGQKIEAWMIPRTIPDNPRSKFHKIRSKNAVNINFTSSDPTWVIEKSIVFPNKIEVILHSNNYNRTTNRVSSDYLRIDIPKDFFDVSSSDQNHTSDEEVYKIVEYESTVNVVSEKGFDALDNINIVVSFEKSRDMEANILTDIETVIKRPPSLRDVVIQGSNVMIPRCDVIGVGIITQRDLRDIRKPILKIRDESDLSEEETFQTLHKKCEFAESYLHDYYKHLQPLDADLFSLCASESRVKSGSEKSFMSLNPGEGSKSCPNIFEDYQSSAVVSSCNTSSYNDPYDKNSPSKFSAKLLGKLFKTAKAKTDTNISFHARRVLPKDSLEVCKRRKIYAAVLKATWACDQEKPVSVPSFESKEAQDGLNLERPKCSNISGSNKSKRSGIKHTRLREPLQAITSPKFKNASVAMVEISPSLPPCEAIEQPPCEPLFKHVSEPRPSTATNSGQHTNGSPSEQRSSRHPNNSVTIQDPGRITKRDPSPSGSSANKTERCNQCPSDRHRPRLTKSKFWKSKVPNSSKEHAEKHKSEKSLDKQSNKNQPKEPTDLKNQKPSNEKITDNDDQILKLSIHQDLGCDNKLSGPSEYNYQVMLKEASTDSKQDKSLTSSSTRKNKHQARPPVSIPGVTPMPSKIEETISCRSTRDGSCEVAANIDQKDKMSSSSPPIDRPSSPSSNPCPHCTPQSGTSPLFCSPRKLSGPICNLQSTVTNTLTLSQKPQENTSLLKATPCQTTPRTSLCITPPQSRTSRKSSSSKTSGNISKSKPLFENPLCELPSKISLDKLLSKVQAEHISPLPRSHSPRSSKSRCSAEPCSIPTPTCRLTTETSCSPPQRPSHPCSNDPSSSRRSCCVSPPAPKQISVKSCSPPPKRCSPSRRSSKRSSRSCSSKRYSPKGFSSLSTPRPCSPEPLCLQIKSRKSVSSNSIPSPKPLDPSLNQCLDPCSVSCSHPCSKSTCISPCEVACQPSFNSPPRDSNCIARSTSCIISTVSATQNISPESFGSRNDKGIPVPSPGNFYKDTALVIESPYRTSSDECTLKAQTMELIQLNSHDNLKIIRDKDLPDKEDRRKGIKIEVNNNEGQTVYNIKDNYDHEAKQSTLLNEVKNKTSTVQRVSKPIILSKHVSNNSGLKKLKDSGDNLIEIKLKLKITQGDKTTEIKMDKDKSRQVQLGKTSTVNTIKVPTSVNGNSNSTELTEDAESKSNSQQDFNIKIIVKSYKTPQSRNKENPTKKINDEFSKQISQKFKTVSTVYNDTENASLGDHKVYSIHRTTVDLNSSEEVNKTPLKDSKQCIENNNNLGEYNNNLSLDVSANSNTEMSETDTSPIKNQDSIKDRFEYVGTTIPENDLDTSREIVDIYGSECSDIKVSTKQCKKDLLKKVLEKIYSKPKNKENVKQLKDMLKIILTDSSDNEDSGAVRSELVKDVTYKSLNQDYYRDNDGIINYNKTCSSQTIDEGIKIAKSTTSEAETSATSDNEPPQCQGCICSILARGLNCNTGDNCCCNKTNKMIDENNSCYIPDEQTDNVIQLQNVETQISGKIPKEIIVRKSAESYVVKYKTEPIIINKKKDKEIIEIETVVSEYSDNYTIEYTADPDPLIIHESIQGNDLKRADSYIIKSNTQPIIIKQVCIDKRNNNESYISCNNSSCTVTNKPIKVVKTIEKAMNTINNAVDDFPAVSIVANTAGKTRVSRESQVIPIRKTTQGVPDNDQIAVIDAKQENNHKNTSETKRNPIPFGNEADILQCYATKRAVLEIYAEKTKTENGERFVAKLPKFVLDRERNVARSLVKLTSSLKSITKNLCKIKK